MIIEYCFQSLGISDKQLQIYNLRPADELRIGFWHFTIMIAYCIVSPLELGSSSDNEVILLLSGDKAIEIIVNLRKVWAILIVMKAAH